MSFSDFLLNYFAGVPEKEVRGDGGAEECQYDYRCFPPTTDLRDHGVPEHGAPIGMQHERGSDVREEREAEPLQYAHVVLVWHTDLEVCRDYGEEHYPE